jgi:SAM-dependent methyltransferase
MLEVGTGQGSMLSYLIGLLGSSRSITLTTVDIDPQACARARERLSARRHSLRSRVEVVQADVVDWAPAEQGVFGLAVASALLSAVPLARPFGTEPVLEAIGTALRSGGLLFLQDYLPLPPPGSQAGAAALASAIWRWHKAVAELSGIPHYAELPVQWVSAALELRGFTDIRWVADDRRVPRSASCCGALLSEEGPTRQHCLDEAIWSAMDRYRRDLLRKLAEQGLVQWSGSYRLTARKR